MSEERRADPDLVEAVRRVLLDLGPVPYPLVVVHQELDRERLLADIKSLLADQAAVVRCRFSEQQVDGVMQLLTGGGDRKTPLADLRRWLTGAERLVIADPYLLQGAPTSWGWSKLSKSQKRLKAAEYAEEINRTLGNVEELDVFHLPDPPSEVATAMKKIAFKGRKHRLFSTTDIHDRVWIKDATEARVVGTSFGSIGRKLAFILPLPEEDLRAFQKELQRIRTGVSAA